MNLDVFGAMLLEARADGSFPPLPFCSKGNLRHFSMKLLWANPKGLSSCCVYPARGFE